MKIVILAGGLGTRLSEETDIRPKPMVEIGGKPILWHIMKIYSAYGFNEFIVCCGYKGYVIKEYFANYFLHTSDVSFDMGQNRMAILNNQSEPWNITLVDTGDDSDTGGRLRRVADFLQGEECFGFTYGDGVSDVNLAKLLEDHQTSGLPATLTAVRPPGRYGALKFSNDAKVEGFFEKPEGDGDWISGGFFFLNPSVLNLIDGDQTSWEKDVMPSLAGQGALNAFKHFGFWQPMDTLREKIYLNDLWMGGNAPWKIW